MAGICTARAAADVNGTNHAITVLLDGVPVEIQLHDLDAAVPMTAEELQQFVRFAARRLRSQGTTLATFLNRVLHGDEASNVRNYDLVGAGSAVTLTNMNGAGALTYTNVLPGPNGQRTLVDVAPGNNQFRLAVAANYVGTGPYRIRLVRDSDNAVAYESANIPASGERDDDSDWLDIPEAVKGALVAVRLQIRSATAGDDPVVRRATLLVR